LDRVALTHQHTLIVVAIEDRKFVLGASPSSCQVITELKGDPK
jgi:flagellar biogenesis protein FliO